MTTTEAQLLANRDNGQKSYGPITDAGKAIASRNATKHGFLSQQVLLPSEDPSEFETFQEGMRADLQPLGQMENFLFGQIVAYSWRLRRFSAIEGSLLTYLVSNEKYDRASEAAWNCFDRNPKVPSGIGELRNEEGFYKYLSKKIESQLERDGEGTVLGKGFVEGQDGFRLLSRYETSLQRNLMRNLGMFYEVQRNRRRRLPEVGSTIEGR